VIWTQTQIGPFPVFPAFEDCGHGSSANLLESLLNQL
jgi:hypothetical protein